MLAKCLGGCCFRCGYDRCLRALDFHHIDESTKLFGIGACSNKDLDLMIEEVKKCVLLCSNCHRELHDGMWEIEGTPEFIDFISKPEKSINKCKFCDNLIDAHGGKFCSLQCFGLSKRTVERPSKEKLEKMVWEIPTTKIAKIYNVSDKAVEKWCKKYEIIKPHRGYWSNTVLSSNG